MKTPAAIGMKRHQRRASAKRVLADLFAERSNLRVIHYSCESFRDRTDTSSPRVTSIAVMHHGSGQTRSFSIHRVAERNGKLTQIESVYDDLERAMLSEFFEYVTSQPDGVNWLHWNMRDSNYGFAALEHRFAVLGGRPTRISDSRKHDLPVLLKDIYGYRLAPHPRFERLVDINELSRRGFLNGEDEAAAFEAKEYVKLHQSTLKKVDLMAEVAELAAAGELRTNASWWDQYGYGVMGMYDGLTESPTWKFLSLLSLPLGLISALYAFWPTP